MKQFEKFMASLPLPVILIVGFLLVGLLGGLDFTTGPELSFSIFYLLPICLVTWFAGRWPGVAISLASAVVWLVVDHLTIRIPYSYSLIPFWNALARLGFFLITTWVVSELRSNRARRRALERIFFHDILNVTGSLRGFAELLQDHSIADKKEIYSLIRTAVEQSIDEIESQRIMTAAEHLELPIGSEPLIARALLGKVADLYRHQEFALGRNIVVEEGDEILFYSDSTLLMRVLGNLVKNALEASKRGETVRMGCRREKGSIEIRIWNRATIPEEFRDRIFQRMASGKTGRDRGVGTHSVRLLTEYLGGEVSFTSEEGQGTTFLVRLPNPLPKDSG